MTRIACLLLLSLAASAQDPFEIHVYQYETLAPGEFTLEQHFNYVPIGSKQFDGTVAPSNDQLHLTYELTAAVVKNVSVGFMFLTGEVPGHGGLQYAGWRVLPHLYVPRSWHWPLDAGFVAEFSFQKTLFEENSRRVELRPIVEKSFGPVKLTANPVVERALHGPGVGVGWGFEPAARIGYQKHPRFAPSLEYYGSVRSAVHQLYAGGDLKFSEKLLLNLGAGVGLTPFGDRLVLKSRLEYEF